MEILSLEQIRDLPEAPDYSAGVYFLWLGDELQYIGMSTQVRSRLALQEHANKYHGLRTSKKLKPIPFDRNTCVVVETGPIPTTGLKARLLPLERAYIKRFKPPFNIVHASKKT